MAIGGGGGPEVEVQEEEEEEGALEEVHEEEEEATLEHHVGSVMGLRMFDLNIVAAHRSRSGYVNSPWQLGQQQQQVLSDTN